MRSEQSDKSIWNSALRAANCGAYTSTGRRLPVQWRNEQDHLCFLARHEVVVQPFGIHLNPGEVLEVTWQPNDTAYSLAVREADV